MHQKLIVVGTLLENMEALEEFVVCNVSSHREYINEKNETISQDIVFECVVPLKLVEDNITSYKENSKVYFEGVVIGDDHGNPEIEDGVPCVFVNVTNIKLIGNSDPSFEDHVLWLLIGNLGRDPDFRYLENGTPVCNISVAVNFWAGKKRIIWVRCSAWGSTADFLNTYAQKGQAVYIEARPVMQDGKWRMWEGSDGQPRASFEASAFKVITLKSKTEEPTVSIQIEKGDSDIPF